MRSLLIFVVAFANVLARGRCENNTAVESEAIEEATVEETQTDAVDEADDDGGFHFTGDDLWPRSWRALCDDATPPDAADPRLLCHARRTRSLRPVREEVLSVEPLVLRLHQLVPLADCDQLINAAYSRNITPTKVVSDGADERNMLSPSRQANGTWINPHNSTAVAHKIWRDAQEYVRFNLSWAEHIQVLMYDSGGHYAPHYDFLPEDVNVSRWDGWQRRMGNRIATFLLILDTADKGGGTVFPALKFAVQPNRGDALLWFNAMTDGTRAQNSIHGACPIEAGRKIAATIWIRTKGQELHVRCPSQQHNLYYESISFNSQHFGIST